MIMIMMMIMISIINTVYKRIVTYSDARRKEFTISAIRSFIDDDYDELLLTVMPAEQNLQFLP